MHKLKVEGVLTTVKWKDGSLKSVTVFAPALFHRCTCPKSFFGRIDIVYSYGLTCYQLENKHSLIFTGEPLPEETFELGELSELIEKAEKLGKKDLTARKHLLE